MGPRDSRIGLAAAAVVTVFSTLNLVMGSTRRAREHHDLARRFVGLEQEMVQCRVPSEDLLTSCLSRRLEIEANEPPVLRNLDTLCHNEQLWAEGHGAERLVPVRWYQRWFAQVWDIGADRYVRG